MKVLAIGSRSKINLGLFAEIDGILEAHKDDFADSPDFGTSFGSISEKLKGLGYDVLINNRAAGEFVPSTRLGEVVAQRDTFKAQAEGLAKELDKLQKNTTIPDEVQTKLKSLADDNAKLLSQLEDSMIAMEVIALASDAHVPQDVAAFLDRSKISVDKDGKVHGAKEEIDRIKAEKPYMFKTTQQDPPNTKGGNDNTGGGTGGSGTFNMNAAIRRAAGHVI